MSFTERTLWRVVLLLSLVLFLSAASALAQSQCKLKAVKVKGAVAGRVFLDRGGERQPLSGVAIDILDKRERKLVASASSGEDGSYMVSSLEPGSYLIKTTHMIAATLEAEFELAASDKPGADRLIILILGADESKPCGGGRVETEKIK
jgi:hypothetical protein